MPVTLIDPDTLPHAPSHRQVAVGTGSRLVFMAGQVAWSADGSTVGLGDLTAQTEQAYLNVGAALAAAGASFDDVVKLAVYVVDLTPDKMPLLMDGLARAAAQLGVTAAPPITGIGVGALAAPDLMIEIEATAVLD